MQTCGVQATELKVGDPARRRAGLAIVASMTVVVVFGGLTVFAKEIRGLEIRQPWQDDPYDVPVSFDFLILPVLVVIGALRTQLCHRYEPLPARRLVDLLRVCGVAVAMSGLTALAEWAAVMLGLHARQWSAATTWQVASLGALTAALIGCGLLLRRARGEIAAQASAASQPDWLADAVTLCQLQCRRLGSLQGPGQWLVGWLDKQVIERVRARPVAAAAVLTAAASLPFVAVKVFVETYPAPLAAFVFTLSFAVLFAFAVIAGSYLRVVAPRQSPMPVWLCATVVACVAGPATFAFHDSLLSAAHAHQTAATLTCLLVGGGAAAGLVSLVSQTAFRRVRNSSSPRR